MLSNVLDHFAGVLVEEGIVLDDKEAVMILFQDGHELKRSESSAHIQFCDIAVQATQDTGIVAANEEDFVPL